LRIHGEFLEERVEGRLGELSVTMAVGCFREVYVKPSLNRPRIHRIRSLVQTQP